MKMNLTKPVIELLKCINIKPGLNGIQLPKRLRSALRTAEDMDLIMYSASNGWNLTSKGKQNLESCA